MGVEVGALSLKLTEDNLKAVLKDVNAIDQAAARIAKTMNGPVEASFQKVGQRATQTGRTIQMVGQATERQYANAAQKVAAVGVAMANSGQVGAQSLGKLITTGSSVAFMFGVGGPIVSAIGLTGLAIYQLFKNARDEMEKTRVDFEKNLNQMVNAADNTGLTKAARNIWISGNAEGTGKPGEGLGALEAREAELQQQYRNAVNIRNVFLFNETKRALKEIQAKIAPLRKQYDELMRGILNPFPGQSKPASPVQITAQSPAASVKAYEAYLDRISAATARHVRSIQARQRAAQTTSIGYGIGRVSRSAIEPAPITEVKTRGSVVDLGKGPTAINSSADLMQAASEQAQAQLDKRKQEMQSMGEAMADAFANGMQNAFRAGSIGGAIAELGKGILSGLGSLFIEMGKKMIIASTIMQAFINAINSLLPGAGFAAGVALIALGSAMNAVGGSSGRGGGGGYGGGYSGRSSADEVTKITLVPTRAGMASDLNPKPPVNVTIIGADDPRAQTQILDLIENAQGRAA